MVIAGWLSWACDSQPPAAPNDSGNPDASPQDGGGPDAAASDAAPVDAEVVPSCEIVAPLECEEPAPTYEDVRPIFSARCVACHNGAGEEWPLTSYQHVADWSGEIRAQMLGCTMPPPDSGLRMPDAERDLILRWLRCGFPR